jgi:hypothetical protein
MRLARVDRDAVLPDGSLMLFGPIQAYDSLINNGPLELDGSLFHHDHRAARLALLLRRALHERLALL